MVKRIRIMGRWFRVRGLRYLQGEDRTSPHVSFGQVFPSVGIIELKTKDCAVADDFLANVLLHEVFEVLKERLELPISHDSLCALSETMFTVMRDNPQLVKFIMEANGYTPMVS